MHRIGSDHALYGCQDEQIKEENQELEQEEEELLNALCKK